MDDRCLGFSLSNQKSDLPKTTTVPLNILLEHCLGEFNIEHEDTKSSNS